VSDSPAASVRGVTFRYPSSDNVLEAIDLEANTFKLKNVDGEVGEFVARDPANLAKAAVGDAVVVTTIEAMAVEVIAATLD